MARRMFVGGKWVLAAVLLLALSCGKTQDDRDRIRSQHGEPDEINTLGKDPFWREVWIYSERGVGYEFRRTAPKCGGGQDVYLYASFIVGGAAAGQGGEVLPEPTQREDHILGP